MESRTPVELALLPGAVFAEAPFQDGYDLTIGTSERGSEVASAQLPSFRWVQPWGRGQGTEQGTSLVGTKLHRLGPYCMWGLRALEAAFSVALMSSH